MFAEQLGRLRWRQMATGVGIVILGAGLRFGQSIMADEQIQAGPRCSSLATAPPSPRTCAADSMVLLSPQDPKDTPPAEEEDEVDAAEEQTTGLRKLTAAEINRIRYMELRGMRMRTDQPDRVTVKIPEQTINDFLVEMEGLKDFEGKKAREDFRKLTAPLKLHKIAYYRGAKYADRVEITSDPEVFIEFKKNVQPIVLRSCASSSCHGSGERATARLVLFNDQDKSAAKMYANFIMLNECDVDGYPLIDRGQPENSLLLTHMLPIKDVKPELRHPGEVKYRPIFQTRTSRGYRRILNWIKSLKHPAEDYGVRLTPMPERKDTDESKELGEKRPEQANEKDQEKARGKPQEPRKPGERLPPS